MKTTRIFLCTMLTICFLLLASSPAQADQSTLYAHIQDICTGASITSASVILVGWNNYVDTQNSDVFGNVYFRGLWPGQFSLSVNHAGYITALKQLNISGLLTVQVALQPLTQTCSTTSSTTVLTTTNSITATTTYTTSTSISKACGGKYVVDSALISGCIIGSTQFAMLQTLRFQGQVAPLNVVLPSNLTVMLTLDDASGYNRFYNYTLAQSPGYAFTFNVQIPLIQVDNDQTFGNWTLTITGIGTGHSAFIATITVYNWHGTVPEFSTMIAVFVTVLAVTLISAKKLRRQT